MPKSSLYVKPRHTRHALSRGFSDIMNGEASGVYPALNAILGKSHERDICTPDCEHRNGPELIRDVRPPLTERMAVMEHMAVDIKEKFEEHRQASTGFASKESVDDTNRRIDREVLPAIDRLTTRSTLKTVVIIFTLIGLLLSMAYNGLNIYKNFHL